jgi:uncharacterized SAM-binding protein YcdF (DUF218 family)
MNFLRGLMDFLEPPGLVMMTLLIGGVWLLRHGKKLVGLLCCFWGFLAVLMLCTQFPSWLVSTLEDDWKPLDISAMPRCDAVICLGGGTEASRLEPSGVRLKGGADRVFMALEIARSQKAGALVLCGGRTRFHDGEMPDADATKAWLEKWDLSPVPIHSVGACTDTHDEAVRCAQLATEQGWKHIALATSASHMRRAKAVFEKQGLQVLAAPCDYLSEQMRQRKAPFLSTPDLSAYRYFDGWMHEVLGLVVYRLRGWI